MATDEHTPDGAPADTDPAFARDAGHRGMVGGSARPSLLDRLRRRPSASLGEQPRLQRRDPALGQTRPISSGFPANADTDHEYRQNAWTNHALALGLALSLALNLVQGGTIWTMMPLKRVEPLILQQAETKDQLITLQPLTKTRSGLDVSIETWCRQWVTYRYSLVPDRRETALRIAWLAPRTAGEADKDLRSTKNREFVDAALKDGLVRTIHIDSYNRDQPNFAIVEWTLQDTVKGTPTDPVRYRSFINFTLQPREVKREDIEDIEKERFVNPFGFVVTRITTAHAEPTTLSPTNAGELSSTGPTTPSTGQSR